MPKSSDNPDCHATFSTEDSVLIKAVIEAFHL